MEVQCPLSITQDWRGGSIFPVAAKPLAGRNIAARIVLHVRVVVMIAAKYAVTGPPPAPATISDVRGTAGVQRIQPVPANDMLWFQGRSATA